MNVYVVHCRLCPGVGNFNLALLGWRIWPGNFKSFQRNKRILTFNMEVFKSEKITFASRWLSRNGLQESPWYKSCLYNKNDHKIQRLGIWSRFCSGGENLNKLIFTSSDDRRVARKRGGGGVGSLNWSTHYYQINLNFLWFTVAINDRSGQPGCL